jgi:DNA polymerase-4
MKPILEVTENKCDPLTATFVAKTIRQQIRDELHLTASAGVAPNKLLAKIASDWRKPDGLFVIQPSEVNAFLPSLPIGDVGLSNFAEAAHADLSLFH